MTEQTPVSAPKVSVCIPTYNRAQFIGEAIQSVLDQSCQDFEIIVYDDASTDETEAVVRGIADPRIRYFRQPQQVGISRNRNSCLAVARGEYIGWLDSDDIYLPHMLAEQSAVLDAHPSVGLVHAEVEGMDERGLTVGMAKKFAPEGDVIEPGLDAFQELCAQNYIHVPSVLVRRSCYEQVGGYNPTLRVGEDSEMWLRIALRYDLAYRAAPVARKRAHPGTVTGSLSVLKLIDNRVRSVRGVALRVPRRHAGARLLQRVAFSSRLAQVLWLLADAYKERQPSRTLLGLLLKAASVDAGLLRRPTFWHLVTATARRDDLDFDRYWRRVLTSALLDLRHTRQGAYTMGLHYYAAHDSITRELLRSTSEDYFNPARHRDRRREVEQALAEAAPGAWIGVPGDRD